MNGHGIARKGTGYVVLSRPNTSAEYWQADLKTIRQNTLAQGRNAEYEIVPCTFTKHGVSAVQTHEAVAVYKPKVREA